MLGYHQATSEQRKEEQKITRKPLTTESDLAPVVKGQPKKIVWIGAKSDSTILKKKAKKKERLQQFTPPVLGKSECMEKIEQLKSKKKKLSGNQKRKLKMLKDNLKSLSQWREPCLPLTHIIHSEVNYCAAYT